ncbi:MAG: chemotaxis protein CheX [Pontiellaceae bacterium]|nr:chemotaxis protein CheX [Pontiellaceae bacterium]
MNDNPVCSLGTLREAISQVFTSMVFMAIDPTAPIDERIDHEKSVFASVSFMGKYDGSLTVRGSIDCAKAITANLLAFEEDDPIEQSDIADAMGEIANMIMGSIKSLAYDTVGELVVSAPTVFSGQEMIHHLRAGEACLSTTVGVDDIYCLEVHLVNLDGK